MASSVKSKIEGKLDPLPDEGYVDDDGYLADNNLSVAVNTLRIRVTELRTADRRLDVARAEHEAAMAEVKDRVAARDAAKDDLIKAATA